MIANYRIKPEEKKILDRKMKEINKVLVQADKHAWTPQKLLREAFEYLEYAEVDPKKESIYFVKK